MAPTAHRQLSILVILSVALVGGASANYIGYALGCANDNTINCDGTLQSKTLTTVSSCSKISVGCYTSFTSAQGCGSKDNTCPKCVDNGNSVTLSCSSANCPSANPIVYTGICGDPHFSAPGGIFFDWHGERDQDFSIISDTTFQMNAHFIGERTDTDVIEHGTWIQEVSMGYKENNEIHFVSVGIDQEKEFEAADVLYFTFDNEDVFVGSGTAEYTWSSPDGRVIISRAPHQRAKASIKINGLFEATFFPRVESRIQLEPFGKYLDMDLENLSLSRHAHGVLGQMFRPDAEQRKEALSISTTGHEFLVEGATKDYRVSNLTAYDSTFNQFDLSTGVAVRSFNILEDGAQRTRKMLTSEMWIEDAPATVNVRCCQKKGSLVCG